MGKNRWIRKLECCSLLTLQIYFCHCQLFPNFKNVLPNIYISPAALAWYQVCKLHVKVFLSFMCNLKKNSHFFVHACLSSIVHVCSLIMMYIVHGYGAIGSKLEWIFFTSTNFLYKPCANKGSHCNIYLCHFVV